METLNINGVNVKEIKRNLAIIIFILFLVPIPVYSAEKEDSNRCQRGSLYAVELIFGLSSEDGKGVSEQQWDVFVKTSISGRFPGSTTIEGLGRYYDTASRKEVIEKSKIVILVIECSESSDNAIKKTVEEYKQQFKQKSVLRIDSIGPVIFYE
jgi:uncharacterized protein DUF3574